jgi:nicotinate-nucleotide adenylyltransferase
MVREAVPEAARVATRIGIFGGTFDPIHCAHVEVAEAVRQALGLDRMLLVVANEPWQKQGRPVTPAEDRYAMVAAAAEGRPGLEPCRMEIDRGGPSYTIDTVEQLRRLEPQAALILVVGSDVVAELPTWKDEPALRDLVSLAVVGRPGAPRVAPPPGWHGVDVSVAPFDVSSTELRRRIEAGESLAGLVPDPVIHCIVQRGLYATGR